MSVQNIYNKLKTAIGNDYGVCGLMGNLKAESNMQANNLQNTYAKKFGMTDEQYTEAVDNGSYTNFVKDSAGYGLAQWTYWSRKDKLLKYAQASGTSIGDEDTQVGFLLGELTAGYPTVFEALKNAKSVREASDIVLTKYERPADQFESVQVKRASYGEEFYRQFVQVQTETTEGKEEAAVKYNANNKPLVCMQTTSRCYKGTRKMTVKGVLWHSTGANNPTLKRYVQPSDNASDREYWLQLLGKNKCGNDWNHSDRQAGMNCWIGKLADGTVTTVQTMPWDYRPWGCGSGKNGSCNNGWIQFEICEDDMTGKDYFNKAYKEACEITAYLCNMFNLDPHGYTTLNGIKVPVILCHADSHDLGLGSNHGDIYTWFKKHGKDMDDVRNDVAALMKSIGSKPEVPVEPTEPVKPAVDSTIKVGDTVKIADNATYYSGKAIPSWVKNKTWIVSSMKGDRIVVDKSTDGKSSIRSPINAKHLSVINRVDSSDSKPTDESVFVVYKVKVTTDGLNIRKGPGIDYDKVGIIEDEGVYTIVDEVSGKGATKWGKLKSGAGWISLDYVKKI